MRASHVALLALLAASGRAQADAPTTPPDPARTEATARLDRRTLVARAVAASPAIARAEAEARRAEQSRRVERGLEAPTLGVEMWNAPLSRPWALGRAEMFMVEVREELPAPGVRGTRASAASHERRAALAERSEAEREATARASVLHAAWVASVEEADVLATTLLLVSGMRDIVIARYGARAGTVVDLARLDAELEAVRRREQLVRAERETIEGAITALLGLPPGASLGEPVAEEPSTVSLDESGLGESIGARGRLEAQRERIAAADDRTRSLVLEARRPSFGVSLSYWQEPSMRPGYGAGVMMSLPWLSGRNRAMADEAREERAVLEAELRELERDARVEATETARRLRALAHSYVSLSQGELPALERAAEVARSAYATGAIDLPGWIEAHRATLEGRAEAIALRRELESTIAELERLVGRELPRVALEGAEVEP